MPTVILLDTSFSMCRPVPPAPEDHLSEEEASAPFLRKDLAALAALKILDHFQATNRLEFVSLVSLWVSSESLGLKWVSGSQVSLWVSSMCINKLFPQCLYKLYISSLTFLHLSFIPDITTYYILVFPLTLRHYISLPPLQVLFSYQYEVMVGFTRDYEAIRTALLKVPDNDKTVLGHALSGVSQYCREEWGNSTPCQVNKRKKPFLVCIFPLWAFFPVGIFPCGHFSLWVFFLWAFFPVGIFPCGHFSLWAFFLVGIFPCRLFSCGHISGHQRNNGPSSTLSFIV